MGVQRKMRTAGALVLSAGLLLGGCRLQEISPEPSQTVTEPAAPELRTGIRYMQTLPEVSGILSERTPEKEYLLDLTTVRLYRVEEGEMKEGLARMPEDVTEDYAGLALYGVPAGAARGYAFRIGILPGTYWQDGAAVTAEDMAFTLRVMLEDEQNYENLAWIANAEEYHNGWEHRFDEVISLSNAGYASVAAAREAGLTRFYVDTTGFWGLDTGWIEVTDQTQLRDPAMPSGLNELYVTAAYLYEKYLAEGTEYQHMQAEFVGVSPNPEDRFTIEDVGILPEGPDSLILISRKPVAPSTAALYLKNLRLMREDMYGQEHTASACCSYGPYVISESNAEEIRLLRNPSWQGDFSLYPADEILCRRDTRQ